MNRRLKRSVSLVACLVLPFSLHAQGLASDIGGLQGVLDQLYQQMIPLCSRLIGAGRGIAGFAATWYIASRVWAHIARAEPIDFYPLFRPFVLGFAILVFPLVIALINGILQPVVNATSGMVQQANLSIALLLQQKQAAMDSSQEWLMYAGTNGQGNEDKWYQYAHPGDTAGSGLISGLGADVRFAMNKASYDLRSEIKQWLSEVLEVLYEAAALCINTIRTFYLIVLAILGPLVFGLSVFDGFRGTLTAWLARYINVFMWLPVANLFGGILGSIEQQMLKLDISQIRSTGNTFFSASDIAYLIFMIIAITGYFTVPSVSSYIVQSFGNQVLGHRFTGVAAGSAALAAGAAMMIPVPGAQAVREDTSSYADPGTAPYIHHQISGS
ncbi:MAG TPA: conjugative transposon protein TraJ [Chitinophagaceae bacterium]|nr:conjugative transposon protein TraJ [Chitinophagaceae bacterium]